MEESTEHKQTPSKIIFRRAHHYIDLITHKLSYFSNLIRQNKVHFCRYKQKKNMKKSQNMTT